MFSRGRGIPQDHKEAVKWYTLSAEQGYDTAQFNLGIQYHKGLGVPQDYKSAVKWYTLSAEQGYSNAQTNLAVMYALGDGVNKDRVYAHMWANIAYSNGNKGGKNLKDKLIKMMIPSQIEEAERLARE